MLLPLMGLMYGMESQDGSVLHTCEKRRRVENEIDCGPDRRENGYGLMGAIKPRTKS